MPEVLRVIAGLGRAGPATYGGGLRRAEVPASMAAIDIGVVAVRRSIAEDVVLSTKIMEYMIMGKPVIASRRPILEQYLDRDSLVYFEDGNVQELSEKILELWRNPARRAQVVAGADAFLHRHPWEELKRDYVGMFRDLCV